MNALVETGIDHGLREKYRACRRDTLELVHGLSDADLAFRASTDAQPALRFAQTSWHFEQHVLARLARPHRRFDAALLCTGSASIDALLRHRHSVDTRMDEHLSEPISLMAEVAVRRALLHETQQQELLLVDLLSLFARNPLRPAHPICRRTRATMLRLARRPGPAWVDYPGGRVAIGHDNEGDEWIAPEAEQPRHERQLPAFALAAQLVSNRDWCEFIDDGGYARAQLWSPQGWQQARAQRWQAPLYWRGGLDRPVQITLAGTLPLDLEAPVCHISAYEADAYARWAHKCLPTEAQWEVAASAQPVAGNFSANHWLRPIGAHADAQAPLRQLYGDVWEWTSSAFAPYPRPGAAAAPIDPSGAQAGASAVVLRGGSCATPFGAVRASTRYALAPQQRRHFSGLRLAQDRS